MSRGLLLDTCTLLWLAADQSQLSPPAKAAIADNADALFVSAISAFEIGIKHARGKLMLQLDPVRWFSLAARTHGFRTIAVSSRIAAMATQLPYPHNDPADRIIISTAQLRDLAIITPDTHIRSYPNLECVW